MAKAKKVASSAKKKPIDLVTSNYDSLIGTIRSLVESARHSAARSVNALMTATYWQIGRRIVEFEQRGDKRAGYGQELLKRLAGDLTAKFGRGFGVDNLELFRAFYLTFPPRQISETLSRKSESSVRKFPGAGRSGEKSESLIRILSPADLVEAFPLSWTHYIHLIRRSRSPEARKFYEAEALRGGWSVRQLDRQMASLFYERVALSKNKADMLTKAGQSLSEDRVSPAEEIKDPFVLEFLDLKDEYSESDLEEELIRHLEHFL